MTQKSYLTSCIHEGNKCCICQCCYPFGPKGAFPLIVHNTTLQEVEGAYFNFFLLCHKESQFPQLLRLLYCCFLSRKREIISSFGFFGARSTVAIVLSYIASEHPLCRSVARGKVQQHSNLFPQSLYCLSSKAERCYRCNETLYSFPASLVLRNAAWLTTPSPGRDLICLQGNIICCIKFFLR